MKRLSKKFPSLKTEYSALIKELEENPEKGIHICNNCFKIRLAIASKGRGKSGGAWTKFRRALPDTIANRSFRAVCEFV